MRNEYEHGQWSKVLSSKEWRRHQSVRDYVTSSSSGDTSIMCIVDGVVTSARRSSYYCYRAQKLSGIMKRYARSTDRLVEIGAGAGTNLFSLYSEDLPFRSFIGLDISRNAIQAGSEIASHFGITSITFDSIDLLNGDDPGYPLLRGNTVFTYYCLEQLHRNLSVVIENILRAKPSIIINIEPTRELLRRSSLLDLNSIVYSHAMDYPGNIISTLRSYADMGRIVIDSVEKLDYAPTLRNYPSLVVWRPSDT